MKHLVLIFAVAFGFALNVSAADKDKGHKRVGVDQFAKILKKQKLTVIDVRTPDEFGDGHIKGAKNINFYDADFKKQIGKLDKSKAYLVHCRSGGRSARASKVMVDLGFKLVYDLAPGMMGWEEAGKPVVEGKE